jgi:hypothetical protein
MGMSGIRVNIDRLVLSGVEPRDRKALVDGLRTELARLLADPADRAAWARNHRTPVLKLGRMPMEPGPAGGRRFGTQLAGAVAKGLKP